MSHLYTLMVGGTVIPNAEVEADAGAEGGPDATERADAGAEADATAIAWAEDTVLLIGSDDDVRAISRGDSQVIDLQGATVIPLRAGSDAAWPTDAVLEVGGPADLAVLRSDPRRSATAGESPPEPLAIVRAGRLAAGRLPAHEG